jgi:hypothetical protein
MPRKDKPARLARRNAVAAHNQIVDQRRFGERLAKADEKQAQREQARKRPKLTEERSNRAAEEQLELPALPDSDAVSNAIEIQPIEHADGPIDVGMNLDFDGDWGPNLDEEKWKHQPPVVDDLELQVEHANDLLDDWNNWDEQDGVNVIVGFPEIIQQEAGHLEPIVVPPVYPGNNYFSFFGENTQATIRSFSGIALVFRNFFIDSLRGTNLNVTYFIYNLPIFVAVLVLRFFTDKNASYASGNVICKIVAKFFAVFGIEFPKTIPALFVKLGVKDKHNDLEVKVACKICSKVYDYQVCAIADPTRRGRLMSKVCTNSIFPFGTQCNEPLLEHTLGRTGEKVFQCSLKQRFVCPGN